jgi:hypothetical protein
VTPHGFSLKKRRGKQEEPVSDDGPKPTTRVVADAGMAMESVSDVRAHIPVQVEHLAAIRADITTQLGWLDAIAAGLQELRASDEDPAFARLETAIASLRAELNSAQRQDIPTTIQWLQLTALLLGIAASFTAVAPAVYKMILIVKSVIMSLTPT